MPDILPDDEEEVEATDATIPSLQPQPAVRPDEAMRAFPRLDSVARAREQRFRRNPAQLVWDIDTDTERMLSALFRGSAPVLPPAYFFDAACEVLNSRTSGAWRGSAAAFGPSLRAVSRALHRGDARSAEADLAPVRRLVGSTWATLCDIIRRCYPAAPSTYYPPPSLVEEGMRRAPPIPRSLMNPGS